MQRKYRVSYSSVKTVSVRNTEEKDIFAKDSRAKALCYLRNHTLHMQLASLVIEQCSKTLGQKDKVQSWFHSLAVDPPAQPSQRVWHQLQRVHTRKAGSEDVEGFTSGFSLYYFYEVTINLITQTDLRT